MNVSKTRLVRTKTPFRVRDSLRGFLEDINLSQ